MSMLDVHAAALASVNEAYHSFLLRFNKTRKVVYGFVEGKDDPSFYRSVIERFIPEDWAVDLVLSGNRDKVLNAEKAFDWTRFSRKQVSFFVDRDLTDFTVANPYYSVNTYVTDNYSIENSLVTADMMLRLLSEVHNVVDWTPAEQQLLIDHFNAELAMFSALMAPLMSQILVWRVSCTPANLNNLDLPSLFSFVDGRLTPSPGFETDDARLDRLCECVTAPKASAVDRLDADAAFQVAGGQAKFIRGKYLIWFLSAAVNEIHRVIGDFVAAYSRPPKSKLSVGPKNLMVVAAPRARIPATLRTFIENGFNEFILASSCP